MPTKEVKLLYANARGLRSKVDSLQTAILHYNPDIILIVETHTAGKSKINIKGYKETIVRNRKTSGGGLLIAKKDNSKINLTALKIHETEEQLWAKINNTIICLAYGPIESRTEKSKIEEWYYEIEQEFCKWEDRKVIIIGDFNAKVGCEKNGIRGNHPETSNSGKILKNMNERRNLTIMNNEPVTEGLWTREDPSGKKSVLDYVITNELKRPEITQIIIDEDHEYKLSRYRKLKGKRTEFKSDHNTILIKMKEENVQTKNIKYKTWNIKNQNSWNNFKNDTENMKLIDEWGNEEEMNKGYKKWQTNLKSLMYKHFERITIKDGKITSRKIRTLTNRRKAISNEIENLKKSRITGVIVEHLIEKQQTLKKEITEEVEIKRIEQMKRRLGNICNKASAINEIWNIRKSNMSQTESNMGIKSCEGNLLTSPEEINDRYKSYFQQLLQNREINKDHEKHQNLIHENHNTYMKIKSYDNESMNNEITMREVDRAIKSLKKDKAPGPDELYNEIIINAGKNLKANLLKMMNNFWKLETIPEELYRVEIKSLYKGKGDIGNLENHRGIFLNSNILKFIERIILFRATDKINSKMSPYQAGGRSNFSIGEQVYILRSILEKYNYYNQPIYLQFIDLKKAFDKMVVKNILQNLWESGIRGKIWRFIKKINDKAIIRIKTNAANTTDEFTTKDILKQGSVLAANLAAMHTDTLAEKFRYRNLAVEYGNISLPLLLFQDDVVKFDKSAIDIQASNIILESFQFENKMEFHPTKTMIMTNQANPPEIILNKKVVPITNEYKYLGDLIVVNNDLHPLIWERKNVITGTVCELMNILSQTRQYSFMAATQYLEGIITPKLLLNAETWPRITEEDYMQIEQIHSQAIKRLLRLPYSTPTRGLLSELGIMSTRNQIMKKQLMFLHRILNKPDNTVAKAIMKEQEAIPGNTWIKKVKSNMKIMNLEYSLTELETLTKPQWKKIVDKAIMEKEQLEFTLWTQTSKKCNYLDNIKRKNYLNQMSPEQSKIILEIRLGILDVKDNYHHKYNDTTCRNCKEQIETAIHFIECNTQDNHEITQHLEQIWKIENIETLKQVANHILQIMEENEHIEYKRI